MAAVNAWVAGTPGGDEAAALFGSSSVGLGGYLAIFGQIVLMAVVTALTSRHTVDQTLAMHRMRDGNKLRRPRKSPL